MAENIEGWSVHPGMVHTADTPGSDALYVTPEQLQALTGMDCGEDVLRFAQSLYDQECNRRSLWPCTYEEHLSVPEDRQEVQLTITPVIRVLQLNGAWSPGRRNHRRGQIAGLDWLLVAGLSGARRQWVTLPLEQIDLYPATGRLYLPYGAFPVACTEVRVRYLAGFPQIPHVVKMDMAEIVHNIQERGLSDRIKYGVGKVVSEYKTTSFIPEAVRQRMQPFVVRSLY